MILEAASARGRRGAISLDFDVRSSAVSPGRQLARKERLERFESALGDLRPEYRSVLRLVRIEGLSVAETARRMERSPNAISHLLLRALRKLRESFGDTESFALPSEGLPRDEEPEES